MAILYTNFELDTLSHIHRYLDCGCPAIGFGFLFLDFVLARFASAIDSVNFNSEEFVPKSAVGQIIATATSRGAKAGEARTLSSLQNSRSRRSNLGL